mgnify:CR=1 FL=1
MLIIGIAGGSGSGKTTVVKAITEQLQENVVVIPQDSYYKDLSHYTEEQKRVHNFDHPDSIDFDLLRAQLAELREGKEVDQPIYSYITCGRSKNEVVRVKPADVIIVEGILIFTDPQLRKLMDIKIFVDADADDRLIRVAQRDIVERGRTIEAVMERYQRVLKPMHEQFIETCKRYADVIIPQGGHNNAAINMLVKFIKQELKEKAHNQ